MIDHDCYTCRAKLALCGHTQVTRVGRYRVRDASAQLLVCENGHPELEGRTLAAYQRRAAATVLAEAADVGGEELRFARKAIGRTQAELGKLLGYAPETISRMENEKEVISRVARIALRDVVLHGSAWARIDENPARTGEVLEFKIDAA